MNVLHITPHMGGGVGTVIRGWLEHKCDWGHRLICLDKINECSFYWQDTVGQMMMGRMAEQPDTIMNHILYADIVLVHYWDHTMLAELFSKPIPPCRLAFWLHKNTLEAMTLPVLPDMVIKTSPVQGAGRYIWSTGGVDRFLEIQPKEHEGFNIGYCGWVDYRKIHPHFFDMCLAITARSPGVKFTMVGENRLPHGPWDRMITYVGHVDDIAPYLAEMDVFGYPLRPDHWGTCEQVLGEAMAAGVVPVTFDNSCEKIIIEDAKSGYLESSEADYVDAIQSLYSHGARESMSKHARSRAKELYSLDTMIEKWDKVFEEMMQQPKNVRYPL